MLGWASLGFLVLAILVIFWTMGPKSPFNGKGPSAGAEGLFIFVVFGLGSVVISLVLLIVWLART